jgi:hypothetical protein
MQLRYGTERLFLLLVILPYLKKQSAIQRLYQQESKSVLIAISGSAPPELTATNNVALIPSH